MPTPRVLISDALSPAAVQIFKDRGVAVDFQPDLGKDKDRLAEVIGGYDGLAIRSATKVTAKILEQARNLKVIGRAGIGVDNVDVPAATARGVIVMNTPFGNSITTAEHAIAMMFALARQIPQADASTQAGKWEKNRFMGVEMTAKTLGVIGCGNIGAIVASRAIGLHMKVIAYDPFLSPERALELGVEKVELDDLLRRADVITLHVPLTDKTRNILSAEAIARTKKGVRIVNCARGGLVDEVALRAALDSGHVAGAAFDVFLEEPATANPLFGHPNVVCTPHLGAATAEAQENVALQVAEQMSDYLLQGAIQNAVNFPSITAEEAPRLRPFVALAEKLGSFVGQLTEAPIRGIRIEYEGVVAGMNTRALTSAAVTGALRPFLQDINMVAAPVIARERGITVEELKRETVHRDYESFVRVTIDAEDTSRHAGGTVFQDGKPRVIEIRDIAVDAEFAPNMIFVRNAESRASSAASARCSARRRSTSRLSRSAATGPGATPSASWRWTSRSRPTFCAGSRRSRRSSARGRCGFSRPAHGCGRPAHRDSSSGRDAALGALARLALRIPPLDHKIGDEDLNRLAVLVQRRRPELRMPRSGRDFDGRSSKTSLSTVKMSSGLTGFGQRNSSIPAPMTPPAIGRLSTSSRIVIAALCEPLAASPPKKDRAPSASSRWNGCGSNSPAKRLMSSVPTRRVADPKTAPTLRSSR